MKARIEIRDIPLNAPAAFLESNGTLILDLPEGFTFSLTKAATEGNEVNVIKREGTSSFPIPITDKNLWILSKWIFPNLHSKDFSRIRVHAFDGAHILAEDRLDVLRVSRQENTIEIGLFESPENGIADGANSLLLNTVDFGSFELTAVNLETNWANGLWEDGVTDDFYFPLIHWGNFIVDKYAVSIEDFRPLLSVPATLVRCFCTLGWKFDSPLLQTEWFRRLWWYGLKKDYYNHSTWGRLVKVDVEVDSDLYTGFGGFTAFSLYFNTETFDDGNNHNIVPGLPTFQSEFTQTQPQAGFLDYHIWGQIEGAEGTIFNFVIGNGWDQFWKVIACEIPAGGILDIDIAFTEAFPQGLVMNMLLGGGSDSVTVKQGFRVTINPTEKYYHRGDIIAVKESLDSHYTFLQFIEGLLHAGFRFDIDFGRREVIMYATEQADIFGEGVIEGYYLPGYKARDMKAMMQHRSENFDYPKEDTPEALIIAWRKSTDKRIETLEIPEDAPLYSKRLEFPTGVKDKVDFSENPFFEPTANYQWFGQAAPQINTPAMWDNTESQRSFEINPRIMYAAGLKEQSYDNDGTLTFAEWSFEGANRQTMPYAFQVPGALVGYPPALPVGYIVYDDPEFSTYSLWNMWMKHDNRFYKNLPTIEVLMLLSSRDYHIFSFRNRVEVEIFGRPTILKVLAIRDFQTEKPLTTPVTLQIDPNECA